MYNVCKHILICIFVCMGAILFIAAHGERSAQPIQDCLPNAVIPSGYVPFSEIYSITAANSNGDRLVVGRWTIPAYQTMLSLPMISVLNQRFCDPVQLGPNTYAVAYVPLAQERAGDFSAFAGLLIDPVVNQPFPGGIIPPNRQGAIFAWRVSNTVGPLAAVSAASYSDARVANESIVALFGNSLAGATVAAPVIPLPTSLGETSVKVKDSAGIERLAPLFFVSPTQINCLIPREAMSGKSTLTVTRNDAVIAFGSSQISTIAPALFAANANGQGAATALALRVKADGTQSYEPVIRFDSMQNKYVPIPIDLGAESDQVFLILFGTGIRFRSSLSNVSLKLGNMNTQVVYAGEQEGFVGLDQINLLLSRSLKGHGEIDVSLTADGQASNIVRISIL